ncbi:hypothetical protein BGX29_005301 [Mortierella sp. GBA35]|nr:hypothetical protein BGX29_005301 [Mortierella sp. GBA35]
MIELTPYPLPRVAEEGWPGPVDYSDKKALWQEPQITVRLDPGFASPSRLMVAEYMIMAGRVASMFAQENGLPTLFRNQSGPAEKYRELFEETIRTKTNPQTGMLSMVDMLPLRPYIAGAEISTSPLGHWSMGMATARLRVIRDRERMMGMLEARSIKYWLFEMLRRRLDGGVSNVFEGIILNPTADGYNVISTLLGFQTVVKADPEVMETCKIGDRVVFEVNNCNPQRPWIGAQHLSVA